MTSLLLLASMVVSVHVRTNTVALTPTCPSTPTNTHKLVWMKQPEVTFQWCINPNNSVSYFLSAGKLPADDTMAAAILIKKFAPHLNITNGTQPVMQASATGVLTPYTINGVAQTITGPGQPDCLGPGVWLKGPGGNEVMYSAAGYFTNQGNLMPGPTPDVIKLPAVLVWCYLTLPPAKGW